jgi:sec-independent protein translocase protein TatC
MAKEPVISEDLQKVINKNLPFLIEIRRRLLFAISLFFVFGFLGFFYYERIIRTIIQLLNLPSVNIVFTSPFQFMDLAISSGVTIGLIATFPLLVWQILAFLKPALRPKEFKIVVLFIPVSIFLFLFGFSFGAVMMKYVIGLFYQKSQELSIGTMLDISSLLSKIIVTSALMGIAFEFPIIITALINFGIVKYKDFAKQRPIAYTTALFFAALLPPTDILSLLLLTLPLVILFEFTLLLNKLLSKKK